MWYQRPSSTGPRTGSVGVPAGTPRMRGDGGAEVTPAGAFHAGLPGYGPTPLVELPGLARELGVGRVFVKDESTRLGLGSFKVLGASWAVYRVLGGTSPRPVGVTGLRVPRDVVLVAATDGNHGRAVAWMARLLGVRARIVVPDVVPRAAVAAIEELGAAVTVVTGSYDDAVRRAAAEPGVLVQDTAWPGYEDVPRWIVEGYSTLFVELDHQVPAPVDLLVVPMGVGSLAQAALHHVAPGAGRGSGLAGAAVLGVEPQSAAGVLESLRVGRPVTVATGATVMAGLNCGTPSAAAWPVLRDRLDAAVAVTDEQARAAVRGLAALGVAAGACGAASLAGVRAALADPGRRAAMGVDADSVVVLLSTEGP